MRGDSTFDGQLLGLQRLVEVLQPALHVGKLGADGREPAVDLTGQVVDLLGHQGHQLGDGLLGENPLPDLLDYQVLYLRGVQVAGGAGSGAFPEQAGADVVGELAADPTGTLPRGRPLVEALSPANFAQEHDSRSSALGEAYSLRELEDRLEEVSKAYDRDTQSIELQRKLFEAGRYKDMEAEIKRSLQALVSNPVLPGAVQLPGLFLLGTLYLAGLSHHVRGKGISHWPGLVYPITAGSLGYEVEELRSLAKETLVRIRSLGQDSDEGLEWIGHLLDIELAMEWVDSMSPEAFDVFDSDYLRKK